jgi:hypothetical protein
MNKIFSLIITALLINFNCHAMEQEEGSPYHFVVFKNKVDLQSDENKTTIQDIFYEKEGCVLLLDPSEENSKFLTSLYSSTSTQVEFFQGENEFSWPLTHYNPQYKEFMYWPKNITFSFIDLFFMRNREPLSIYQHPLPLVGCYVKQYGIDKSLDNFINSEYFKERLSFGAKFILRQNIMKYYYSDESKPLIIKITKEPVRGLWRE